MHAPFIFKFHQDLVSVYSQLKDMCSSLRHRGVDVQDCCEFTLCEEVRPGALSDLLQELKELMQDVLTFKPTVRFFIDYEFWLDIFKVCWDCGEYCVKNKNLQFIPAKREIY